MRRQVQVGASNRRDQRVVSQTQSTVGWGLEVVPEDGAGLCTVATEPTLPVRVYDASGIAAALAGRTSANGGLSNGGNNAAAAAVEVAARHLSTLTDDNRRVIVLVTDGVPNCPPDDGNADDGALAVQAITQAARWGFPTFVVGFAPASQRWSRLLDQMAVAGGTGRTTPFLLPRQHVRPRQRLADDGRRQRALRVHDPASAHERRHH